MLEAIKFLYYHFVCFLVRVFSFIFCPTMVYGRRHLPKRGGFLLAANHQSHLDPALIPSFCSRRMRFIAKDSLFRIPVLGALIRFGGGMPIKRGTADKGALDRALQELKNGYGVLVFPQGTRGGEKIAPGIGFLAAKSRKPVVPVWIEGTDKVLPRGARFPRRRMVTITFGKPISVPLDQSYDLIAHKVMAAVSALEVSK